MKITSIDVFALKPRYMPQAMRGIVCRVNTDTELYGYGEAAVSYGKGSMAGFHMIKELAPLLLGQDPLRTEYLWERMFMDTFWGQSGGPIFYSAMSAMDIALMDIKGKAFRVPCYQLIGGKHRDKVRAYASQLQLGWPEDDAKGLRPAVTPEEYAREAECAIREGYTAIKTDFTCMGPDGRMRDHNTMRGIVSREMIDTACARLKATREAVGPDVDIIVECHSHTDALSAVQYAQAIEPYGIYYFEEGTYPMNTDTAKNAARKIHIPMANGSASIPGGAICPSCRMIPSGWCSRRSPTAAALRSARRSATWPTSMTPPYRSTYAAAPSVWRRPCRWRQPSPTSRSTRIT